jgi:hypothetical protein
MMNNKLEEFFIRNEIKQILVYKTKAVLRVSQPFTQKMLEYITNNIDGKIVLLKEDCVGQAIFEDTMQRKYTKGIDHFVFSPPLIAVILKNKKMKREEDWCVFQSSDRKYFYKFNKGFECWALNDENGKFINTFEGERLDIIASILPIQSKKEENKDNTLNKMIDNNNYIKKEVGEIIKKITYIVNNNINYDTKTKVYTFRYGKNKIDIIDYLNVIRKLLNNI